MSEKKTWFQAIAEKLDFTKEQTEELEKAIPDNSEQIAELKKELEAATEGNNVEKLQERIDELEKAAKPEPKPEDIFKGQPELKKRFEDMEKALATEKEATEKADKRATDNEDKFNKSENARRLAEFTKKAEETYPSIPGDAEVKGRILKAIEDDMDPDLAKELTTMLSAGEEGLRKALITLGADGVTTGGGLEKIQKAAEEIVAKDNSISKSKAMVMAEDQNPVWAAEYKAELQ